MYVFLFSPVVLGVYVLFDSTNVNTFLYILKSIYLNLFFKLAKTQLKSLFWPPLYKIKNLVCFPIILDISWPCLTSFGSTFTLATVMTARSTKVKLRALHLSYIILFFLLPAPGLLLYCTITQNPHTPSLSTPRRYSLVSLLLECGLDLKTCFQRIEYRKGK